MVSDFKLSVPHLHGSWNELSLLSGPSAIFSNCKFHRLLWAWERQIQSCSCVGTSALSHFAMENVLNVTLVWNASVTSDVRTTTIYNPDLVPKAEFGS